MTGQSCKTDVLCIHRCLADHIVTMQAWPIPVFAEDYSAILRPVQAQCALQRCPALSTPLTACRRPVVSYLAAAEQIKKDMRAPHSADTPLQVFSLTGSPRLGAQTPAFPPAPAARGPTPATAVQMELQPSSELAGHASPHAVSGSSAQRSVSPSSASAQQSSRQVSLGMSSEQASAGNNAASMQTSSALTQHAQMLPATAAPQNFHQDK